MRLLSQRTPLPRLGVACGLAALLTLVGCKGGGDHGNGNSVQPCTAIIFTPAISSSPPNGSVYLRSATSTCTSIDVGVFIANLSGIYTVGFDLTYPANLLQYQGFIAGPLLFKGSPTVPPLLAVQNPTPGRLVAYGTRFRPDTSVAAVGSEVLVIFHFVKVAGGSGTIDFDSSSASLVSEEIIDDSGNVAAASFGPGHGGVALVP